MCAVHSLTFESVWKAAIDTLTTEHGFLTDAAPNLFPASASASASAAAHSTVLRAAELQRVRQKCVPQIVRWIWEVCVEAEQWQYWYV